MTWDGVVEWVALVVALFTIGYGIAHMLGDRDDE